MLMSHIKYAEWAGSEGLRWDVGREGWFQQGPMSSLRNSVNSESASKRFKPSQADEVLPVNNAEVPDVIRQFWWDLTVSSSSHLSRREEGLPFEPGNTMNEWASIFIFISKWGKAIIDSASSSFSIMKANKPKNYSIFWMKGEQIRNEF